jgi:hypothetical protein
MRVLILVAGAASAVVLCASTAQAAPADFPDLDSYPAVDPAVYEVSGAPHPSASGWAFKTPGGLRCANSLIPDLGVSCQGPAPDARPVDIIAGVTLTKPGFVIDTDGEIGGAPVSLLPVGSKLAAGNGVVCATLDNMTLACQAAKPYSWPADIPDPPGLHYGEHGFVVGPTGSRTY